MFVCGSAEGVAPRPMILRDGNLILEPWFSEENQEVVVGHNTNGVLDVDALALYIKHELVPYIKQLDPPVTKVILSNL